MAKPFNITSATFDGTAMTAPQHYRAHLGGVTKPNSSGTDTYISGLKLAERHALIEVFFNDQGAVENMFTKHGSEGSLVIVVPLATGGNRTITIANAVCTDVAAAAEHAEWGLHSCMFEAYAPAGAASPISVA